MNSAQQTIILEKIKRPATVCLICGQKFEPVFFDFHIRGSFHGRRGSICLACMLDTKKRKILVNEGLTLPTHNEISEAQKNPSSLQKASKTGVCKKTKSGVGKRKTAK